MIVLGIDEVGRGSIAGPLVVGAVVLSDQTTGFKDSKLLSRNQRNDLSSTITKQAHFIGLGWVKASELDMLGLSAALSLAGKRALQSLRLSPDRAVLDGNFNYLKDILDCETLPKADTKIQAVSAASIIAKVARDSYMIKLARKFPAYGFETHVGYCTEHHQNALKRYGPCLEHRQSFEPVKSL